jgi:excinuclease UvrABC nuclease subunit
MLDGDAGPYPAALRALFHERASGVYAIRDRESGEVLYVGESHTGRLYHTLTRHFQRWGRQGKRYKNRNGANDPGVTYGRGDVEVRWMVTPAGAALRWEARWIATLAPRDNVREADAATTKPAPTFGLPDIPF